MNKQFFGVIFVLLLLLSFVSLAVADSSENSSGFSLMEFFKNLLGKYLSGTTGLVISDIPSEEVSEVVTIPPFPPEPVVEEVPVEEVPVEEDLNSSEDFIVNESFIEESDLNVSLNENITQEILSNDTLENFVNLSNESEIIPDQIIEEVNNTIILANNTILNESLIRERVVVGRPVKWVKTVVVEAGSSIGVELPKEARDIVVKTGESAKKSQEDVNEQIEKVSNSKRQVAISSILTGKAISENNSPGFLTKLFNFMFRGITGKVVYEEALDVSINPDSLSVNLSDVVSDFIGNVEVSIEYYTEAPQVREESIEKGKRVIVSGNSELGYQDILAYTILEGNMSVPIDSNGLIQIYWYENGSEEPKLVDSDVFDLDGDSFVDYIEWNVPHLSEQKFEIIFITKAVHLDSARNFVADVYDLVKAQDGNSFDIPSGDYLRVTFERNLTLGNDMTIYASGTGSIEVFNENAGESIGEFAVDSSEIKEYKIYPNYTNSDVYDLLFSGDVSVDYIVDPTIAKIVSIGGTPDVSGNYVEDGIYAGQTSYKRQDGAYYLWYQGHPYYAWYISIIKGDTSNKLFYKSTGTINGVYPAMPGNATGSVTVSDSAYNGVCPGYMLGAGNSSDPCEITDWTDLDAVRNNLTASYILMNSLTAEDVDYAGLGSDWIPIGNDTAQFTGNFNGNNNTISNLTINLPSTDYVGLFGYVTGDISNVNLNVVNVTGQNYVGGLAGSINGGSIFNSSSIGIVSGGGHVGGLVGSTINPAMAISNSYSTVNVTGSGDYVGGLTGSLEGTITNSYAIGKVNGSSKVGGLIGIIGGAGSGTLNNSYATGAVTGSSEVGGLVGTLYNGFIGSSIISNSSVRISDSQKLSASTAGVGLVIGAYSSGTITSTFGTVYDSQFGNITFLDWNVTNPAGGNLFDYIYINNNSAYVNGSIAGLNKSANITLTGLRTNYANPKIYRDGTNVCNSTTTPSCYNFTSLNAGTVVFNVSSWSNYSIEGDVQIIGVLPNINNFSTIYGATNFSAITDFTNVTDLTLATQFGKIQFASNYGVNISGANLDSAVVIGNGFVSVNTSALSSSFNHSANITLNNLACPGKIYFGNNVYSSVSSIIAEGNVCNASSDPSCTSIVCVGNNLTFTVSHFTGFAGAGAGTPENPYQITNWTQLNATRNNLTASYLLMNNLSAEDGDYSGLGSDWMPIGDSGMPFSGNFNGNGKTISNLTIPRGTTNVPANKYLGLFGYVSGGNIYNINMVNVTITGYAYVGGLVGWQSSSNITNSFSTSTLTGGDGSLQFGGLVGHQQDSSSITNSFSTSTLIGGDGSSQFGGLVGHQQDSSSITNSFSTSTLIGGASSYYFGGLVGSHLSFSIITNSSSTSTLTGGDGSSYFGGLVGYQDSSSITNSAFRISDGSILNSSTDVGLIVGLYVEGAITSTYGTIYDIQYGNITFLDWNVTNPAGGNLLDYIQIGNNSAYVNSSASAGMNKSANITLTGLRTDFVNPKIYRDGAECTDCYNFTSLNAGTVKFNVSGWSNYSIQGEPFCQNGWLGEGTSAIPCQVTSCGNLNISNAYYTLQSNISTVGTCFNITSDDLVFDLNGFNILGDNSQMAWGIVAMGRNNLTIFNGSLRGFGNGTASGVGIYLSDTNYSSFNNLLVSNNDAGVYLYSSYYNSFENINSTRDGDYLYPSSDSSGILLELSFNNSFISSNIFNQTIGLSLFSSKFNTFIDTYSHYNTNVGIYLYNSSYNNFSNTTSSYNLRGIHLQDNSNYNNFNLSYTSNNDVGISFYSNSDLNNFVSTTLSYNSQEGIYFHSGHNNSFYLTNIFNNQRGIVLGSGSSNNNFTHIISDSNAFEGIYLSSSHNNNFYNVSCSDNGDGISILSSNLNNFDLVSLFLNQAMGLYLFSSVNNTFNNLQSYDNSNFEVYSHNLANNYLKYNNSYGEIRWEKNNLTVIGPLVWSDTIFILPNFASFNPDGQITLSNLNSSTTITLLDTTIADGVVLKDGVECLDCAIISSLGDDYTFNVTNWGKNYTIGLNPAQAQEYFTFQINTSKITGTSFNFSVDNPNLTVNWGDGNSSYHTGTGTQTLTHLYLLDDVYNISVNGTANRIAFYISLSELSRRALVDILTPLYPAVQGINSSREMFRSATNFFNASEPAWFDEASGNVTDMSYMLRTTNFNQDISNWDTSNVENMSWMFGPSFNQDLSSFNTSKVRDMSWMFYDSDNFNQDLSSWDTSNVENFYGMFALSSVFNGNISNWNTSKAIDMGEMFAGADSFNQPLNWDTSNVQFISQIFDGNDAFNQSLNWDLTNVESMYRMFAYASNFNQPLYFNTSGVVFMNSVFQGATSFNQNISNWDTSNVTLMKYMFNLASSFNQDLSSWNVSKLSSWRDVYNVPQGADQMFSSTNLSTENYDRILIGWANQSPNLNSTVYLSALGTSYCLGESARNDTLLGIHGWIIEDDGKNCSGLEEPLFCGGNGTLVSPYQICNWYNLNNTRLNLSSYYVLNNSLNSEMDDYNGLGNNWNPIGNSTVGYRFAGTFNGNGYSISNLTIQRGTTNVAANKYLGLFGYVSGGNISNIHLISVNITGYAYVGGLVGYQSSSSITHSSSSSNFTGGSDSSYFGGLVGAQVSSSIINSSSTSNLVGGINSIRFGGLVGGQSFSSIINSSSTSNLTGGSGSSLFGGLVGYQVSSSTITNSYSISTLTGGTGSNDFGGLIGIQAASSTITNSYSISTLIGGDESYYFGGLVGHQVSSNITNSSSISTLTGGSNSYHFGGLVGYPWSSSITNSFSTSNLTGGDYSFDFGGLVGSQEFSNITNSSSISTLTGGTGSNQFGGLVGSQNSSSITTSLVRISNNATLQSSTTVGLIVSLSSNSTVTNTYGTVYDEDYGNITFLDWNVTKANGGNLLDYLAISNGVISANLDEVPSFAKPAEIVFKNVYDSSYPLKLLRMGINGQICNATTVPACTNSTLLSSSVARFNVSTLGNGNITLGLLALASVNVSLNDGWNLVSIRSGLELTEEANVTIPLDSGWNLIGTSSPYMNESTFVDIAVVDNNSVKTSWNEAAMAGIVQRYPVYYENSPSSKKYKFVGLAGQENKLADGKGYWIYNSQENKVNLTLKGVGGTPKGNTFVLKDLMFRNDTSGELKNISNAVRAGLPTGVVPIGINYNGWFGYCNNHTIFGIRCTALVYYWDSTLGDFFSYSYSSANQLNSWEGYFVNFNYQNITMLGLD